MSNLEEDINGAKTVINKPPSTIQFTRHSRIYPFTNEDLIRCFDNFDFNNKRCLTVLGGSDQTLDMCLRGASEITTFDINVLTKYYFYLKRAAILSNLTKEEYINFFYPYESFGFNDHALNYNTFCKIVQNLSGDNLIFWSKLFDMFTPKNISQKLFAHAAYSPLALEKQ